jgi:hypothetical protein
MKSILKIFILLTVIGFQSCGPKLPPYSAEVEFIAKDSQGTILVKSVGFGKNQYEAVVDAQINAFKTILFQGIPGTELNIPLVNNESEATAMNKDYFKKFFNELYFKKHLMSSVEASNLIPVQGGKKITVNVKINYNSLRKDLENNQLIRKFGF